MLTHFNTMPGFNIKTKNKKENKAILYNGGAQALKVIRISKKYELSSSSIVTPSGAPPLRVLSPLRVLTPSGVNPSTRFYSMYCVHLHK